MNYRKNGLRVLGLMVAAALGVMAFASAAQALTPGFLVKKLAVPGTLLPPAGGVQEGSGKLLVKNLNLVIECKEFEVLEGLILTGTDADAKLLYKECFSFNEAGEKLETCHVSDVEGGKPEKLHITTNKILLLPIEFTSGDFGILVENIKFFINFLPEKGCPLPLKNEIKGSVCALIESATNDTVEPLILLSEAIQKSAGCAQKLLYGANEAFVIAAAKLFLTGEPHKGLTLGVSLI